MFTLRSIIAVTIVIGLFGVERPVSAQQIEVRALVDETTIGDQEIVNYSIQISGADLNGVETPSAPSAEGLALMQRTPSTQQSMTIINGQLEQSISFGWRYQPVRRGNARIDAATVTVNGRTYTTEAISINVVDQVQRPRRPSPSGRQGWPFVVPSRPHADARRDIDSRDLFIRAVPSKRTARQNEQITIEYRLYFRDGIQLRHSRLTGSWDAEGFWREEFEIDTRPVPTSVVENGLLYHMIVLKRVAVFPTRPGTLTVDPLEIETEAYFPSGGGDPFERFFSLGNRFDTVQLSSDSVELIVQPLPPGAPSSFSGAVGDYRMRASLSATSVEVGEPVEVRIVIEGEGNVATLEAPRFEPAGVFERYDPNVGTSVRRDGRRISGRKSFTFVLVPRSNGEFEMPPVEFTFYHPERSDYVTITSELPELEVTGTAAPLAAGTTSAGLPVDDIAGIITDASSWRRIGERPLYRRVWPYAAVATPLLALLLLFGHQRRADRIATDTRFARGRLAHPLAKKHLKQAEALLRENQPRAYYEEVERAVVGFAGNRLNLAELGLTRDQLDQRLAQVGLSAEDRRALRALLEECDRARFAPILPDQSAMESAHERAAQIIVALDRAAQQTEDVSV